MRFREFITENKIIAYHGTGVRFDQFQQSGVSPTYFTQDKEYAKGYTGKNVSMNSLSGKRYSGRNYLITAELTINHIFDTKNDPGSFQYYNETFLPAMNAIFEKYNHTLIPPLEPGHWVSFIYADHLYRHFRHYGFHGYDSMLVNEGLGDHPSILVFNADQIKILKREIVKF